MSELCPVAVPLEALKEPQVETATEAFLSFLKKKRLCDVTFVFGNAPDKIEAHQFCLRARSPVFDSMFGGVGSAAGIKEVKIEDASPEVMHKFLEFVYADKFDVTAAQALQLLHLGLKYKVQLLVNKCEARITKGISTENAIAMYQMAEKCELKDLRAKAGDFIAGSFEHFLKDPKLMKAKGTTMTALFRRSDLTVKETDLFQLAIQWGKDNSTDDHELAVALTGTLLPLIRFTNMTPQEFTTAVWPTNLLPPEDINKIYAYINGDDSIRNAISPSLKYETTRRNVKEEAKFKDIITFVTECKGPLGTFTLRKAEGFTPFRECISFSTTGIGSCEQGKKFRIQSVIVRWPTRRVHGTYWNEQPPVNFRVLVMRKQSSQELYATKFDTVIYGCNSDGKTQEVTVDPPVEMSKDYDYCIAVVDEHSGRTDRKFTYHHGYIELTANLDDFNLENEDLELHIRHTKRNDCTKALATTTCYNAVHVIRDICFVMD